MTFRIKIIQKKNPRNRIKFQFYLKTDTCTNFGSQYALARQIRERKETDV